MSLDLVDSGRDLRSLEQVLRRLDGEVANPDTADLASGHELLQNGPCVGDRNVGYEEPLGDRIDRREGLVGVLEGHRPVDLCIVVQFPPVGSARGAAYQIQIQVVRLEILQRLVEGFLDVVWVVVCIP